MKRTVNILLAAVLLASVGFAQPQKPKPKAPAAAQPKKAPPSSEAKTEEAPYLVATFDLTAQKLPFPFFGHSIERVYLSLSPRPKSEFETQAEYEAKVPRPPNSFIYAFIVSPEAVRAQYDAERAVYMVDINELVGVRNSTRVDTNARAIPIVRNVRVGSYEASNAFNAKVTVHEIDGAVLAITLDNLKQKRITPTRSVMLPVPRDDAPALKDRIGAIVVCEPSGALPPTVEGVDTSRATMSSRLDQRLNYLYVRVNLRSLWLYDKATGAVLKKVDDYE